MPHLPFRALCLAALLAAPAASHAAVFAEVGADGTLLTTRHAVTSVRLAAGAYEVTFDRDVSRCTYKASLGTVRTPGTLRRAVLLVASRTAKPRAVYYEVHTSSANRLDAPVSLNVTCGARPLAAVVAADGTLGRGSHVLGVSRVTAGTYALVFDRSIRGCGWSVGLGGTANELPPLGLVTAELHPSTSFGMLVHVSPSFSGALDAPLHVTVACGSAAQAFAASTAAGALVASTGLIRLAHPSGGRYDVFSTRSPVGCVAVATVANSEPGGVGAPAVLGIGPADDGLGHLGVAIDSNHHDDHPTHVVLTC